MTSEDKKNTHSKFEKNIGLPLKAPYKFPNKCISCKKEGPDNKYEYDTNVLSSIFGIIVGDSYRIKMPCCKECIKKFHFKKVIPEYLMLVIIIIGPIAGIFLYRNSFSSFLTFGVLPFITILSLVLIFMYQKRNKVVDIFIHRELVIYCFEDHSYAQEFFDINKEFFEIDKK